MFAQQVCLYAIEQNSCCGWRQFPYCDVHLENVLPAVKITYLLIYWGREVSITWSCLLVITDGTERGTPLE